MNAVINPKRGINISHRKEKHFNEAYLGIIVYKNYDDDKDINIYTAVDLRIYKTLKRTYACVWIWDKINNHHYDANGSGYVQGYNFDLVSSAADKAFHQAGVFFKKNGKPESIDAKGETVIIEAIEAINKTISLQNESSLSSNVIKIHG